MKHEVYNVCRDEAGFTLTEMLVAIALISILSAVAYPVVRTMWAGYNFRNDANKVVLMMQRARSEALRRNQQVLFVLTQGTGPAARIRLLVDQNENAAIDAGEPFIDDATLVGQTTLAITAGGFPGGIGGFTPRGMPAGGILGTVTVSDVPGVNPQRQTTVDMSLVGRLNVQ